MSVPNQIRPHEEVLAGHSINSGLASTALAAIRSAAQRKAQQEVASPAHAVWQPDTWLLQRIWQALADAGEAEVALAVARQAADREPLAPAEALRRLAEQVGDHPELAAWLERQLRSMQRALYAESEVFDLSRQGEQLLLAAATAARIEAPVLACAFLERLDQIKKGWDHIFPNPELRNELAMTTAVIGLHPLTAALIRSAIRRFGDAGAHYLKQVADSVAPQIEAQRASPAVARLLLRCVETVRYATLTTMHSQRVVTTVLARAGLADEVSAHLSTVARVQEARRESGLSLRKNDQSLLRQVKRPQADADVDFLVYTLQEAIRAMPVRQITREQRIALSQELATLGMRSDGWTAAGAAATLIDLGALKFATEVVENIAPSDPTRSEGFVALVDGLLRLGKREEAQAESRKALAWARGFEGDNALRATIWGLSDVYLTHGLPDEALALLSTRAPETSVLGRLRTLFQPSWDDDALRDNRLRLAAHLQQNAYGQQVDTLTRELRRWAPRLLDGEALVTFYTNGLVVPLLQASRFDLIRTLLPELAQALAASGGGKHASHVARVADLLAQAIRQGDVDAAGKDAAGRFLTDLWYADAAHDLWQTIYGVAGGLALLLALERAEAAFTLADAANREGSGWSTEV